MFMYDIEGRTREFVLDEPFNHGGSAFVYLIDNGKNVFKKYKSDIPLYRIIDFEIFEFLKACDNKHIFNLLETFYVSQGLTKKLRVKMVPQKVIVDSYTYQYVEANPERLIDRSTDYFLTNLSELESFFDYLADNSILVYDLSTDNIVLSEDRMVVIDPDLFRRRDDLDKEYIRLLNRKALLDLFKNFIKIERVTKANEQEMEELLVGVSASKSDLASQVSKRLSLCKKPIDFIKG